MNSYEKSHVGLGHKYCPVCGEEHDTVVLLDKRLKNTLTQHEFMGFELCDEHKELSKDYVALVELNTPPNGAMAKPEDAHNNRTGLYAHVHRSAAKHLFTNVDIGDDILMYVEIGVIDKLREMAGVK